MRKTHQIIGTSATAPRFVISGQRMYAPEDLSGAVAFTVIVKAAESGQGAQAPLKSASLDIQPELKKS